MAAEISIWDNFSEWLPYRNLALKVEEQIFWVSRENIAESSLAFRNLLFDPEKQAAISDCVWIPNNKAVEILEMLRCLFRTGQNLIEKPVDEDNVKFLLPLAVKFDIPFLKGKCTEILLKIAYRLDENLVDYFRLAVQFKLKPVVRAMYANALVVSGDVLGQLNNKLPVDIVAAIQKRRRSFNHDGCDVEDGDLETVANCPCTFGDVVTIADVKCSLCGYAACRRHFSEIKCFVCRDCCKPIGAYTAEGMCQCFARATEEELDKIGL